MFTALQVILQKAITRLSDHLMSFLPSLFAALLILLGAYVIALLTRWLLTRIFKGIALDRFLRQSGVATLLNFPSALRSTRMASQFAYWGILGVGFLTALSIFETPLTARVFDTLITLLPNLTLVILILLLGYWLGYFFGRGVLVWAVNEGLPRPRWLAAVVRIFVIFLAVVISADYLNFARTTFLSAFIIFVGGAVAAVSMAVGLGGRETIARYLKTGEPPPEEMAHPPVEARSLWKHL